MTDIHTALASIYGEVGYVQKQRPQPGSGISYSYASEASLIEALRPALVEHGVYVSVVGIREIIRDTYATQRGATMNVVSGIFTVRFTHTGGTYIDVEALGEGADSGDKAANKAMTGAYKYALRQTFCIETGNDPDAQASVPRADPASGEMLPPAGRRPRQTAPRAAPGSPSPPKAVDPMDSAWDTFWGELMAVLQGMNSQPREACEVLGIPPTKAALREWWGRAGGENIPVTAIRDAVLAARARQEVPE